MGLSVVHAPPGPSHSNGDASAPPWLSPACALWLSMSVRLMVVNNLTRPRTDLRSSIELEHDLGCYRHLLTLYFSMVSSVCASDQALKIRFFGLTPLARPTLCVVGPSAPWPGGGWRRGHGRLAGRRASFLHIHVPYTHTISTTAIHNFTVFEYIGNP